MEEESIGWVSYNKLATDSDAFFYSIDFIPLIQYKTGTPVSAEDLQNEKYTAGSTNDPDDFSLPDIETLVKPERLGRINSFYSNISNKIRLLQYEKQASDSVYPKDLDDKKEYEEEEINFDIHTSPEAKRMLLFLNKKNKVEKKSDNLEIIFNDTEYEEFELELNSRSTENNYSGIPETLSSVLGDYVPIKKSG